MADTICDFMGKYPEIRIAITLSDYTIPSMDLIENGFDAAIRLTSQRDSSLVARRIGTSKWVLCGAPSYLSEHGQPRVPADVVRHNCLVHSHFSSGVWPFRGGRRTAQVKVSGEFTANSVILIRDLVQRGLGIALLPTYCVYRELEEGALVRLLPDFPTMEESIYVVYPHRKLLPAKVRLLINFMAERFRRPVWEKPEETPLKARVAREDLHNSKK